VLFWSSILFVSRLGRLNDCKYRSLNWLYSTIFIIEKSVLSLRLKDVRAKIFLLIDFFKIFTQSDNQLLVSEMQRNLGVTDFVSEIKCVENYPYFEKLAHVIQHGLQGFVAKNIKGRSVEVGLLRK